MGSAEATDQRVLLVEDSRLYAELMQDMIGSPGSGIDLVHCGELWDAAEVLLTDGAACVLLDLTLPDASGLEGLKQLRKLAPDVPIVVLTALADEEQAIAALKAGAQDYLPKERADSDLICRSVRYAVERAELTRAEMALDRAETLAGHLQRTLLPDSLPSIFGVGLAARYVPRAVGASVGGDWYDVMHLPDGGVGVAIGDVVGHGSQAAALMGQLRTALRAYALAGYPPGEVLTKTDAYTRSLNGDAMATALYLAVDPEERAVRMACAGHVPPVVLRPGSGASEIELPPSSPLGVGSPRAYSETNIAGGPGATLVLCTDGLIESRGWEIQGGLDRLTRAVDSGPRDPEQLCDHILTAVTPAGAGEDDIALVVMQFAELVDNPFHVSLPASPVSLSELRATVGRWLRQNGATQTESYELTVAVGEAAANAIEHAYPLGDAEFDTRAELVGGRVCVTVSDRGRWRPPRGQETGRGLVLMEALADELDIVSGEHGTVVKLYRALGTQGT